MQQIVVNADIVKIRHAQVVKSLDDITATQMVYVVVGDLDIRCSSIEVDAVVQGAATDMMDVVPQYHDIFSVTSDSSSFGLGALAAILGEPVEQFVVYNAPVV